MIPAHKFPLGRRLVWQLIERSFRKYFDRVYFRMRGTYTDEQRATLPMLICANHSSWWDGYVIALVERLLNVDGYLMVEEAQLSRYFFFIWIGCFSVDRHNPRAALQSLKYAATWRSASNIWPNNALPFSSAWAKLCSFMPKRPASRPFCKHALRACKKPSPSNSTSCAPMLSMAIILASSPSSQASNRRTEYSIPSCLESKLLDNDHKYILHLLARRVCLFIHYVPAPHH